MKWFPLLKGWILKPFTPSPKDEALSASSSSGWRFNLAPDEWPSTPLSEAAEADFSQSSRNSEMMAELVFYDFESFLLISVHMCCRVYV